MFTGIIEDLGTVRSLTGSVLTVETLLSDIMPGDSVAVNGICLTADSVRTTGKKTCLSFTVSAESFSRTSLRGISAGTRVNIERAVRADTRLGGHMVSGHVEASARIRACARQGESFVYTIELPQALAGYAVLKGSITVDGISLTIAGVERSSFSVAVIPHTRATTTLSFKKAGDLVNLEPDLLLKYTAHAIKQQTKRTVLTRTLLQENGFI